MIEWPPGVVALPDEPLVRHTAWRTGGPTPWFLVVHRTEALVPLLALLKAKSMSMSVLGAGTHTVVRDGGMKQVVLRLGTDFSQIQVTSEGAVEVGAATPAAALAWWAVAMGLAGVEALAKSSGSVGGCVVSGEFEGLMLQMQVPLRGKLKWVDPARAAKTKLVSGVRLQLQPDARDAVMKRTRKALRGRLALPSWYAKPKKGKALAELKRVAMDGVRLRDVIVPESSPEMVVNLGGGTAQDLALLHKSALERVHKLRGVKLESTARWTGRRS